MQTITTNNMLTRLRRAFAKEGLAIKKAKGARQVADLGEFYVVDMRAEAVIDPQHDLASLELMARDMCVVQSHEGVV